MSSVQKFLNRNLILLIICNQCANVYLIYYSKYTFRHNQITTFLYNQSQTQTTILQLDLLTDLIIAYLQRYHHICIALRQTSKIMLNRRVFLVAGLALPTFPCYADVVQKHNIEGLEAPCCERAFRGMSTPFAIRSAFFRL